MGATPGVASTVSELPALDGPVGHVRSDGSCWCDQLPVAGQRIVVVSIADADLEPLLYVGATGVVTGTFRTAVAVRWDDARLEQRGIALRRGRDGWRVA